MSTAGWNPIHSSTPNDKTTAPTKFWKKWSWNHSKISCKQYEMDHSVCPVYVTNKNVSRYSLELCCVSITANPNVHFTGTFSNYTTNLKSFSLDLSRDYDANLVVRFSPEFSVFRLPTLSSWTRAKLTCAPTRTILTPVAQQRAIMWKSLPRNVRALVSPSNGEQLNSVVSELLLSVRKWICRIVVRIPVLWKASDRFVLR